MIETIVESIRVSLVTQARVVILKEVEGERHLPIWIGPFEAEAIAMELQSIPSTRPLPYDLLRSVIDPGGQLTDFIDEKRRFLDVVRVQLLVELAELGLVELECLHQLVDLGKGDAAVLLASIDQRGDGSPIRVAAAQGHTV